MAQIYHIHDSRLNAIAIVRLRRNYVVDGKRASLPGVQFELQNTWLPKVHIVTRRNRRVRV